MKMKLAEPARIGKMCLKNRIVMPAMGTRLANENGGLTEAMKNHYVARARGGAGLIIIEVTWVDFPPHGKYSVTHLSMDSDRFIAGFSDLVEEAQFYGAKIAVQLYHAGRQATGPKVVAASDVPVRGSGIIPRPLSIEEIEGVVQAFGEAAKRAVLAGFDAIEIHGAHGYLINEFLSPLTNHRADKYGGSLEGRVRFALEVVRSVRQAVGPRYPLIFRMSADEYLEGGLRLSDSQVIAPLLEKEGIDALHVSAGTVESWPMMIQPQGLPRAMLVHLAEGIKKVVKIPVIAVGSINDPQLAEQILQEGKADLIAMGRSLLADPELPNKVMAGQLDDIRPCIRCNKCIQRGRFKRRIRCAVNAATGRDAQFVLKKADKPKKVVVVGGGPAGMESARVLALRGHQVTLVEKESQLGGQLRIAALPPHKDELPRLVSYFETQLKKLGVSLKLGTAATPQLIQTLKPDVVVVATGAYPCPAPFPVAASAPVAQAWDVLTGRAQVGDRVMVLGGGSVGAETAEFLAQHGKKVTIIEMLGTIAADMEAMTRSLLLERLAEKSIETLVNTCVKEVTARGIVVTDSSGKQKTLAADSIVLAIGSVSNGELADALPGKVPELYSIGDSKCPRQIIDAIFEGARTALEI